MENIIYMNNLMYELESSIYVTEARFKEIREKFHSKTKLPLHLYKRLLFDKGNFYQYEFYNLTDKRFSYKMNDYDIPKTLFTIRYGNHTAIIHMINKEVLSYLGYDYIELVKEYLTQ